MRRNVPLEKTLVLSPVLPVSELIACCRGDRLMRMMEYLLRGCYRASVISCSE